MDTLTVAGAMLAAAGTVAALAWIGSRLEDGAFRELRRSLTLDVSTPQRIAVAVDVEQARAIDVRRLDALRPVTADEVRDLAEHRRRRAALDWTRDLPEPVRQSISTLYDDLRAQAAAKGRGEGGDAA